MPAVVEPPSLEYEASSTRTITSGQLFDGSGEVVILHNGAQYRLRITRQDKLILTK